jgi:hypothetical protein
MVSALMPDELASALTAVARSRGVTRSALLRALAEDAVDVADLPSMPETVPRELLDALRERDDEEFARLRALTT